MTEDEKYYMKLIGALDMAHEGLTSFGMYGVKTRNAQKWQKLCSDMVNLMIALEKESGLYND